MSQSARHIDVRKTAQALAAPRASTAPTALTTLILSVLLGLLSGAVWLHAI